MTRSGNTAQVVVVGSFNHDHIWTTARFPRPGETCLGTFASGPGGKGFNQAVAAARQGARVAMIGALGTDALGDGAVALAAREGIAGYWQRQPDLATGTAAIVLDGNGQNLIVVGVGANAALSVAHVQAQRDAIAAARVLLTQHEVNPAATACALQLAAAAGVLRIHNPAPMVDRRDAAPLDLVDVLTPNETEFVQLLALHSGVSVAADAVPTLDDAALHALCRQLPVPTVLLTLGAHGVFVSHGMPARYGDERDHFRIAAQPVTVRDTTAAGDTFNGALAAGLADGAPFQRAAEHANRAAGLKVERSGAALAIPTRVEVLARFT